MHKYQPRVHVIRKECGEELSPVRSVPLGEGTRTFSFAETVFTTVTAYQNQQVGKCVLFTNNAYPCSGLKTLCIYLRLSISPFAYIQKKGTDIFSHFSKVFSTPIWATIDLSAIAE